MAHRKGSKALFLIHPEKLSRVLILDKIFRKDPVLMSTTSSTTKRHHGTLSSHLWDSSDLYRNSVMQLEEAARTMKLDPNIAERLKVPKRALIVSVPIRLDDGSIRVFEG